MGEAEMAENFNAFFTSDFTDKVNYNMTSAAGSKESKDDKPWSSGRTGQELLKEGEYFQVARPVQKIP